VINRRFLRDFDFFMLSAALALAFIGLLSVYSTTHHESSSLFFRQILWVLIGIILSGLFYLTSLRFLDAFSWIFYLGSLVGLVLVLLISSGSHGVRRWLVLGGITVQPSEMAKFGTLLFLSSFLSNKKFRIAELRHLTLPLLIVAIPFLLVAIEPDIGTAIIFLFLGFLMLFYKGTPLLYLFVIVSPVIALVCGVHWALLIGFIVLTGLIFHFSRLALNESIPILLLNLGLGILHPVIWNHLKPYQRNRITGFLFSSHDLRGSGWQILQSKIAIGSGGLFGKGMLKGTQKGFNFLPEVHTDFIMSAIAEEFGFAGCCLVLGCFFMLLWQGLKIAKTSRSEFCSFLAIGVVGILGFQILMNVGMITGIIPVVGVPLPLISYGGSNMVISFVMIGLLLSAAKHRYQY
jgi:rod shape determining protein RodA